MSIILITGATDGIGLETAKQVAALGHLVLMHGRSPSKLEAAEQAVREGAPDAAIETYLADLSDLAAVDRLADAITERHQHLDVVINNAGVLKARAATTPDGLDVRFVVNTLAPYRLTRRLLPLLGGSGRVVNLSSAAQAPVSLDALAGRRQLGDMEAYSQSKLAITMWTRHLAQQTGANGTVFVAVNPGSLLATKMVKDGFGVAGNDIAIGADILVRAALADEFADANGAYFDNDARQFGDPHPDALDPITVTSVVDEIEVIVERLVTAE